MARDNVFQSYIDRGEEIDVTFQSTPINFEEHKYEVSKAVPDMMRQSSMSEAEIKRMVTSAMAGQIGDMILNNIATIHSYHSHIDRQTIFTASFYAMPVATVQGRTSQRVAVEAPPWREVPARSTMPFVAPVQPPRERRVETKVLPMEYATDALVKIYNTAYDQALMDEQDDVAPEKRGLDAVLDHLRSKL